MNCPKCNHEITAEVNFCPNCGEKAANITTEVEMAENLYESTQNPPSSQSKNKHKKKKYIVIASILAAIVIIILVIVISGNNSSVSDYNNSNDDYAYDYNNSNDDYAYDYKENSSSNIEQQAVTALYQELKSRHLGSVDIDATTYSIGTIKESSGCYTVKGSYTLYDDYGQYYKSGTFEVIISILGGSPTCFLH